MCSDFCVNMNFHLSRINAQECICWVISQLHFFFKETAKLFPIINVTLYIPTINVWLIQLLCIFVSICHYFFFIQPFRKLCSNIVILIFISITANEVEQLVMCLFVIPISFSVKCLLMFFAHCKKYLFIWLCSVLVEACRIFSCDM